MKKIDIKEYYVGRIVYRIKYDSTSTISHPYPDLPLMMEAEIKSVYKAKDDFYVELVGGRRSCLNKPNKTQASLDIYLDVADVRKAIRQIIESKIQVLDIRLHNVRNERDFFKSKIKE